VSKLGKTSLVFVQSGAKVNSTYYSDHVLKNAARYSSTVKEQLHVPTGWWAVSYIETHGAFLQKSVPDFIEPWNWPPNSPDLNPVDYSIWGALQQLVYCQKIEDTDHLKQVLNSCWDMISQELINGAIDQWSKRLSLVVRFRGGHIEHRFSQCLKW